MEEKAENSVKNSDWGNIFKENLKILRAEKGLSQRDLALILKCEPATIAQWETGKNTPRMHVFVELCDYFGVTPDKLILKRLELERSDKDNLLERIERLEQALNLQHAN